MKSKKKHPSPFEEIIYFGDGYWDYVTCKKMNIRLIGIDILNDGKLKALGTEHVFQDYSEPEKILDIL